MGKNLDRLKQAYALGTPGMAQTLGAMGRGNDSLVAHITPREAMMLKAMGGSGTINPRTGLLEFDDGGGDGNGSDGGGGSDSGGGDEGGGSSEDGGVESDFGGVSPEEAAATMAQMEAAVVEAQQAFTAALNTPQETELGAAFMAAADARDAFAASLGTSPTGGMVGAGNAYGVSSTQSGQGVAAAGAPGAHSGVPDGTGEGWSGSGVYGDAVATSEPGVGGARGFGESNYGTLGGIAGTLGGLAMGVPGLGIAGTALGTAADVRGLNQDLTMMGLPENVNYGSSLANNLSFGLLGQSANSQFGNTLGFGALAEAPLSSFSGTGTGTNGMDGGGSGSGGGAGSGGLGGVGGADNNGGNGVYMPPATTAPPATTTPSTGGATPSTGGTTTGGTTTTPATPGTFQFAAPVSPAFYGFELNRLMRQYGVPAPTIMPYGGAAASTAQADAAKAAYDQNVYQNYVNEYQNRLANTNMYNMAQFTPNPANFRPQYAAPIANPTYAPANYGGIADVYSKYFGRQPEQAGVEYWGKTGLTGDALQKAITSGAQNMDLEYLRKNYPNMGYARGGRVGYAEGGETETPATEGERPERSTSEPMTPDQARRYRELMTRYLPSTNYGPQLAAAQQTARSEAEAFSNMIRQMSERTESPTSRAEMYFRLASAFGAPTRTGQFTENLALAGREMGEYARGRRADEAERRALGLRAQELRMAGARQDLASLQALAGQESAERRAIIPRIIEAEVRANTPNARQSRIADMMRIHGFDEPTASGIVDGILNVVTDPVTGMSQIVNRATGQSRPVTSRPAEAPAATPAAPPGTPAPAVGAPRGPAGESARPERTLYELASVPRTTGVLPAIGEGTQRVAGQVGANVVTPEFTERRQAFLNVQNEIIRAVINNPRFPVAEQERIRRELNIEPSMLTDPQTLLARIRALDSTLRTSLANREREGSDTSLPAEVRRGALQAANEARNLLQILGVPQEREEPAPRQQRRGSLRPSTQVPRVGQVVDGYTFLGGDPSDQNNWSRE